MAGDVDGASGDHLAEGAVAAEEKLLKPAFNKTCYTKPRVCLSLAPSRYRSMLVCTWRSSLG